MSPEMKCKRNISDQKEVVARVCLFENLKSNWQNMNEFQRMKVRRLLHECHVFTRTCGTIGKTWNEIERRNKCQGAHHKSLRNAIDCNAVPGIEEGEHIKLGFHCNPS